MQFPRYGLVLLAAMALGACAQDDGTDYIQDRDSNLKIDTLLVENACSNCHASDYARVGPSMVDIALVRGSEEDAHAILVDRIKNGTMGNWGPAIMPAQFLVSDEEADQLATAILAMQPAE